MPVQLAVEWQVAETAVVPGARIALRAELVLPAVEVHLFLRTRGSRPAEVTRSTPLRVRLALPGTRAFHVERRMIHSPGAHHLALRVIDAAGRPLSEDVTVGPRDSAWRRAELPFTAPVQAMAWVMPAAGPAPGHGRVLVRGELSFPDGVSLQWSARPATSASSERVSVPPQLQLAAPGATVQAPNHAVEQACPTEAWVRAGFYDGLGHALGEPSLLGRYVLP